MSHIELVYRVGVTVWLSSIDYIYKGVNWMPGKHKPTKVSQAIVQRDNGKYSKPGNGHHCKKSPTGSHHWQIGSPDGELSVGVCRHCDEQRPFANTLEAAFVLRGKR